MQFAYCAKQRDTALECMHTSSRLSIGNWCASINCWSILSNDIPYNAESITYSTSISFNTSSVALQDTSKLKEISYRYFHNSLSCLIRLIIDSVIPFIFELWIIAFCKKSLTSLWKAKYLSPSHTIIGYKPFKTNAASSCSTPHIWATS